MTGFTGCTSNWNWQPQWSRPSIGRMTAAPGAPLPVALLPQWSRPSIGRMTQQGPRRRSRPGLAAMEPTEYRPDDGKLCQGVGERPDAPQWSRPSIGRMTGRPRPPGNQPQKPQWSRPSIGRMTASPAVAGTSLQLAAMEPAEYRPDDQPQIGHRPWQSSSRNGAGRVSAG